MIPDTLGRTEAVEGAINGGLPANREVIREGEGEGEVGASSAPRAEAFSPVSAVCPVKSISTVFPRA